jgi:predicted Zn-ribbon and HTH transcriptional regulator
MLPDWIRINKKGKYVCNIDPCGCERCGYQWYPKIDLDGEVLIEMCPYCKSNYWNKKR